MNDIFFLPLSLSKVLLTGVPDERHRLLAEKKLGKQTNRS